MADQARGAMADAAQNVVPLPARPAPAQIAALQQAMEPSPLVPDRTVAVAADGSVGVDFDLPRFGVSLVTIQPAAGASDGGADAGRDGGSDGSTGHPTSGCGCRIGGGGASRSAALFGLGVLALLGWRRRSIR